MSENENRLVKRLTVLLKKIHLVYSTKINEFLPKGIKSPLSEETLLPIGLISSGLLGNLYLKDFDDLVIRKLNPDYYGRYVDDMLFVIGDTSISDDINSFLHACFVERGILKIDENDNDNFALLGNPNYHLVIQKNKVIVEDFIHYESKAALMKFIRNIQRQRSEFRFLPDEDGVEKDFDEAAFSMQYSGSVNKIRSIKDFRQDKYGASTYLAHKIFLACYNTEEKKKDKKRTVQQILSFFRGNIALDFYSLWEKVFTYFIIENDVESLEKFKTQLVASINQMKSESIVFSSIQEALFETLRLSIAIPLSMDLSFELRDDIFKSDILVKAHYIRHANLFRHQYLGIKGINLTDYLLNDKVNLYSQNMVNENWQLDIKKAIILLAPHHIHYDDICHVLTLIKVNSYNPKTKSINESFTEIPHESYDIFIKANFDWQKLFADRTIKKPKCFLKETDLSKTYIDKRRKVHYYRIEDLDQDKEPFVNKRIAIANLNVEIGSSVIEHAALDEANLSISRRKNLFRIINEAISNKCNVLILPELSVPYQWLDLLIAESKKHNLAIIAGLTYLISKNKYAFNIVVTILPLKTKYYNTCVVLPRVKNHYAPKEIMFLRSYGFHLPNQHRLNMYHLYHWQKSYFSVYNCFELASIEDRALLKSKIDFVVATELNADTNYYSDIAGSWVRDIHAFFIQVNTAKFGDSRIMKPSKTAEKNMVIVKGGRNATALVDDIDIESLRRFQLPGYGVQEAIGGFKNTPPEYNQDDVRTRIKNKDFN